MKEELEKIIQEVHKDQTRWWVDPETKQPIERNIGELIALCHSELSEALEAARKGLKDDHLPHRDGLTVELADNIIRVFDMAGGLKLDLAGAIVEKLAYNRTRYDHSHEARLKEGCKKF